MNSLQVTCFMLHVTCYMFSRSKPDFNEWSRNRKLKVALDPAPIHYMATSTIKPTHLPIFNKKNVSGSHLLISCQNSINKVAKILMYSAHLSLRASVPTRHNQRFNEQPNDLRKEACHTKEGIPGMPRAKPEGGNQAGNQPMRRRLGRQDYSSLKTAGTRTGIPDHSCPPLLPLPHPPLCAQSPG